MPTLATVVINHEQPATSNNLSEILPNSFQCDIIEPDPPIKLGWGFHPSNMGGTTDGMAFRTQRQRETALHVQYTARIVRVVSL